MVDRFSEQLRKLADGHQPSPADHAIVVTRVLHDLPDIADPEEPADLHIDPMHGVRGVHLRPRGIADRPAGFGP